MYLIPFYNVEPELAATETRIITLFEPHGEVPIGEYAIFEFYCPDPACDCRRVMLTVVEKDQPYSYLSSISYCFDRDSPNAGPFLDPLNPQAEYAEELMMLVIKYALTDRKYLARLERHYDLVKAAASDPAHPAHDYLQDVSAQDREIFPLPAPTASEQSVGRNDPCPCGSGKKYKHCCMRSS